MENEKSEIFDNEQVATPENEQTQSQQTESQQPEGEAATKQDAESHEEAPKEPTAEERVQQLQEQLLYKQAEFENYRKRVIKEKADLLLNGAEKTVLAMLPVMDDLERAMQNIGTAQDIDAVREGVELIMQKFVKALEGLGVKTIDTREAPFSTDMHEAIAQIPAPSEELKGKVLDCVQTGYTLNDKVIRYAKVAVGV